VDALLAAGIAEVHVLLRDPDPVASGGLEVLARGRRTSSTSVGATARSPTSRRMTCAASSLACVTVGRT
jgi:pyrimidine deaminase RibD-like protein